jgi:hypothetical protein
MDNAVALVQAYLRINGYFTVSEYPVILPDPAGGYRTATDLDILAFRFPGVGQVSPQEAPPGAKGAEIPDAALGMGGDHPDMLIGEVKEGRAELNGTATDAAVFRAVLTRFGCCPPDAVGAAVERLQHRGHAPLPGGHEVRLVAFGSSLETGHAGGRYFRMTLGDILEFVEGFLRRHWESLRVAESKDPALGFLLLREKAKRGGK